MAIGHGHREKSPKGKKKFLFEFMKFLEGFNFKRPNSFHAGLSPSCFKPEIHSAAPLSMPCDS